MIWRSANPSVNHHIETSLCSVTNCTCTYFSGFSPTGIVDCTWMFESARNVTIKSICKGGVVPLEQPYEVAACADLSNVAKLVAEVGDNGQY